MKIMKKFIIVLLCIINQITFAQIPDCPKQAVYDETKTFTEQQIEYLNKKVKAFEDKTTMEIKLLYMKDISPYATASDFAITVYQKWQLGDKNKKNGLMILITKKVPGNNKNLIDYCRIVTGWGIVPIISTDTVRNIRNRCILPNLPSQAFQAFDKTLDELFTKIDNYRNQYPKDETVNAKIVQKVKADTKNGSYEKDNSMMWFIIIGVIILIVIIVIIVVWRKNNNNGSSSGGNSSCTGTSIWFFGTTTSCSGGNATSCSSCGGGGCGGGGCGGS